MNVHNRLGVSPVIEALLTVAIAIGGGALFYGFYSGLLGTSSQQPAVTVQQTSLSVGTSGTVFAITVKNSGTTSFASSTMTIALSGLPAVGTTTAPPTLPLALLRGVPRHQQQRTPSIRSQPRGVSPSPRRQVSPPTSRRRRSPLAIPILSRL